MGPAVEFAAAILVVATVVFIFGAARWYQRLSRVARAAAARQANQSAAWVSELRSELRDVALGAALIALFAAMLFFAVCQDITP